MTSAINIVPAFPLAFFAMLLQMLRAGRIRLLRGTAKWYTLHMAASLIYCAAIGVQVLSPALYRRELKYFIPFAAFLLVSGIRFPRSQARIIFTMLQAVAIFSVAFLVLSIFLFDMDLSALYPLGRNMWESYSLESVLYSGQFITHSAFGGFLCATILCLYGIFLHGDLQPRLRVKAFLLILGLLLLLYLARSRAFQVATVMVLFAGGVFYFRWRKSIKLLLYTAFVAIGVGSGIYMALGVSDVDLSEGVQRSTDVAETNIYARYYLWSIATLDFVQSPIIGVGISRFDDNYFVLSTVSEYSDSLGSVPREIQYYQAPLVKVDIDPFQVHTDQHAHNIYLHVLAEGGIVFFSLTFVLFYSTIRRVREYSRRTYGLEKGLARGICFAYYGIAIGSIFGDNLYAIIPMFFLASVAGYLHSRSWLPANLTSSPASIPVS